MVLGGSNFLAIYWGKSMAVNSNSSDQLTQLVYASAASTRFCDSQLDSLLQQSRQRNSALDVTGVLLYCDQTFFQVLEGAPEAVSQLYDHISKDSRHHSAIVLSKSSIDDRNFGDWEMGFLRDQALINQLPGFVDFFSARTDRPHSPSSTNGFLELHGDSSRMQQILSGFRRGRWRRNKTEASPQHAF